MDTIIFLSWTVYQLLKNWKIKLKTCLWIRKEIFFKLFFKTWLFKIKLITILKRYEQIFLQTIFFEKFINLCKKFFLKSINIFAYVYKNKWKIWIILQNNFFYNKNKFFFEKYMYVHMYVSVFENMKTYLFLRNIFFAKFFKIEQLTICYIF